MKIFWVGGYQKLIFIKIFIFGDFFLVPFFGVRHFGGSGDPKNLHFLGPGFSESLRKTNISVSEVQTISKIWCFTFWGAGEDYFGGFYLKNEGFEDF